MVTKAPWLTTPHIRWVLPSAPEPLGGGRPQAQRMKEPPWKPSPHTSIPSQAPQLKAVTGLRQSLLGLGLGWGSRADRLALHLALS